MKRKIISKSVGVDTLFTPYSSHFYLTTDNSEIVGMDEYSQWYYGNKFAYMPDRSITPLHIYPVLEVVDADKREKTDEWTLSTVKWYETSKSGTVNITNTTDSDGVKYVIQSDGSIVVKYNVPFDSPITLKCEYSWYDDRNGQVHVDYAIVQLTTSLSSDEVYTIAIDHPSQQWNPLTEPTDDVDDPYKSKRTFIATAYLGSTDVTSRSDIKFQWYYINDSGVESSVSGKEFVALSSVNANVLVLDAQYYSDNIQLRCRIRYTDDESETEKEGNCFAEARLFWIVPKVDGITYSTKGVTVRHGMDSMEFGVLFRTKNGDVSEDVKNERMLISWRMKKTSETSSTFIGYGSTATVNKDNLEATTLNPYSMLVVTPDTELLSPLLPLTDDSGELITDDNGSVVTGSIIE